MMMIIDIDSAAGKHLIDRVDRFETVIRLGDGQHETTTSKLQLLACRQLVFARNGSTRTAGSAWCLYKYIYITTRRR